MGSYYDTLQIIQTQPPEWTSLQVVSRGTPLFPDLLMTGQMRFGRRQGANFAMLTPDNTVQLSQAAAARDTILNVSRVLTWYEIGALVTFDGITMYPVSDWDQTTLQVFLATGLTSAQPSGQNLTLWATPLVMDVAAPEGSTVLQVRSRYNLLNGDFVTFPINSFLSSLTQIEVVQANTAGNSADPNFPFLYSLNLAKPTPIFLGTESQIYLRAFPSYLSNVTRVPKINTTQIGPFVLDYLSTPLFSVPDFPETFSVRTLDGGGNPINGTASALETITKNTPIINRPIYAQNMIFWKVYRGSGGFQSPNKFRMLTDSSGLARVSTELIPAFPSGLTWNAKVTANSAGIFRVFREPYGFDTYNLLAGVPTTVSIQTPAGGEITRLDFLANLTAPNSEVLIADTTVQGPVVSSIQYGYVFQVTGDANYQATSVIVKPMFLSLADMEANYDDGQNYDSGLIYT